MHRTNASGFIDEGGLHRFQNESLPGTPGTLDDAQDQNALFEEIINVVEFAGLTLEADEAADRAAGWIQLRDAIFSSAAIDTAALASSAVEEDNLAVDSVTNSKVADVSVDKLTQGTLDISTVAGPALLDWTQNTSSWILNSLNAGVTEKTTRIQSASIDLIQDVSSGTIDKLEIDYNDLLFTNNTGGTSSLTATTLQITGATATNQATHTASAASIVSGNPTTDYNKTDHEDDLFRVRKQKTSTSNYLITAMKGPGIIYSGTADVSDASFQSAEMRWASITFTGGSFAARDALGNYSSSTTLDTGLPPNTIFYASYAAYTLITAGDEQTAPIRIDDVNRGGATAVINFTILTNQLGTIDGPSVSTVKVDLFYDAALLVP